MAEAQKPLSPLVKRMLAVAWRELEPRVDALYTTVTEKVAAVYKAVMDKVAKAYAAFKDGTNNFLGLGAKKA